MLPLRPVFQDMGNQLEQLKKRKYGESLSSWFEFYRNLGKRDKEQSNNIHISLSEILVSPLE